MGVNFCRSSYTVINSSSRGSNIFCRGRCRGYSTSYYLYSPGSSGIGSSYNNTSNTLANYSSNNYISQHHLQQQQPVQPLQPLIWYVDISTAHTSTWMDILPKDYYRRVGNGNTLTNYNVGNGVSNTYNTNSGAGSSSSSSRKVYYYHWKFGLWL